jgi:hypothetical protein
VHYIIIAANNHTLCSIGIVVPGIEGKTRTDIGAGAAMPVLYRGGVQNAGIIVTVGVKVFYYAHYNAHVKVIAQAFLTGEAHLIPLFAYMFFVGSLGVIAYSVKVKRIIIKADYTRIVKFILWCPIVGIKAKFNLSLCSKG